MKPAGRTAALIVLVGLVTLAAAYGPVARLYGAWYNERFERISPGMSQARVEQLLGSPAETGKGATCHPFKGQICAHAASCWRYEGRRGLRFVIFFDERKRVLCVDDFFEFSHF